MILIALILVAVSILIVSSKVYLTRVNPVSCYVFPWFLATVLAASGLYGIYKPSESTILFILIGVCTFSLGCYLIRGLFSRRNRKSGKEMQNSKFCIERNKRKRIQTIYSFEQSIQSKRLLTILGFLALGIEIYLASRTVPLLASGATLEFIRLQYSNTVGSYLFTTRELLVFQWVAQPIIYVYMVIFACQLTDKKVDIPSMAVSLLGCILYIIVSGGRMILFVFALIIALAVLLAPQKENLFEKIHSLPRSAKVILFSIVIVIALITSVRSLGHDAGVVENIFFYFAGPITYFDEILQDPIAFGMDDDHLLFGRATFGFICNPIEIVFSILFNFDYNGSDAVISSAAAVYLPFSDHLRGNAVCTCLYAFLRDFGLLGVLIGPFLFGLMAGFIWEKTFMQIGMDNTWFPVCVFMMYCVVFSEWRYVLVFPMTGVAIALFAVIGVLNSRQKNHSMKAITESSKVVLKRHRS